MNEILLWRKTVRVIMSLAQRLGIDASEALDLFYASRTCALLHEPKSGLQLMSDAYVTDEIIMELQGT